MNPLGVSVRQLKDRTAAASPNAAHVSNSRVKTPDLYVLNGILLCGEEKQTPSTLNNKNQDYSSPKISATVDRETK